MAKSKTKAAKRAKDRRANVKLMQKEKPSDLGMISEAIRNFKRPERPPEMPRFENIGELRKRQVQDLFDFFFPDQSKGWRKIRGGGGDGTDMPVDSTCGQACETAIMAGAVLASCPEIDRDAVAAMVADACEVYING